MLLCRQDDVLDVYICDTNGKDDVYINDKLVEEGFAEFKHGILYSNAMLVAQVAYVADAPQSCVRTAYSESLEQAVDNL